MDRGLSDGVHREDRDDHRGADRPGAEQGQREQIDMDAIVFPPVVLGPLVPTLIVLAAGALVLALELWPRALPRELAAVLALAGMVGGFLAARARWGVPRRAFRGMARSGGFPLFLH